MLEWNDLLVQEGFGDHVVEAKAGEAISLSDGVRTIKTVLGEDGEPKVSWLLCVAGQVLMRSV